MSDGTYTNVASGGAGTGTISYQSSNTAVATVNGLGLVTFVAAGSTTITANKAADAAHLAASANYTLTITAPQPQTIAFAIVGPVTRPLADGSYANLASGGAGTGAIAYQSSNTAVATVSGAGVVAFVTAGTATITANKAADTGFLAASANYTLTITAPQPQAIAFATTGQVTRPLLDGSYTNLASGGAGTGAITYQSSSTAVATVSNTGVVAFVTAGTATITANKAADSSYQAATASYSLTVAASPPTTPTITLSANNVTPGTTVTVSAPAPIPTAEHSPMRGTLVTARPHQARLRRMYLPARALSRFARRSPITYGLSSTSTAVPVPSRGCRWVGLRILC